ncbi:MAG TPA: hypothetical protein VE732_03125 [Nitrososphaera sp.]|nr:hypothetical protein [Nitrososphaera sp.]
MKRPISQDCLHDVPTIGSILKSLPEETRTCPECGELVIVHESDYPPVPGDAIPFAEADLIGCDATIDKVIEGILREGARQGLTLNHCFEGNKS